MTLYRIPRPPVLGAFRPLCNIDVVMPKSTDVWSLGAQLYSYVTKFSKRGLINASDFVTLKRYTFIYKCAIRLKICPISAMIGSSATKFQS